MTLHSIWIHSGDTELLGAMRGTVGRQCEIWGTCVDGSREEWLEQMPEGLRRLALELGALITTEDHTRTALPPQTASIYHDLRSGGEAATTAESILGTDSVGT
jgi:hypothetical protein